MTNQRNIPIMILKPIMTDNEIAKKEGTYFPLKHYNKVIKKECDVYVKDTTTEKPKLLLKFRKNRIPQSICKTAYHNMYQAAQKRNRNRGSAAGLVKSSKLPKYAKNISKQDKFRVFYRNKKGTLKKDNIGNIAMSNIIGYYDKPDRNSLKTVISGRNKKIKPKHMCRTTAFTQKDIHKWKMVTPYLKQVDTSFKKIVPSRHRIQLNRCKKTPSFQIDNTAFSTVTLNYNWRTACHQDKGDLPEGFGNLLVLEKDKCVDYPVHQYEGGYLGFPKYGITVDVRQGDFLAMDVHQYHCNTPITTGKLVNRDRSLNKSLNNRGKNNREKTNKYGRLSVVCYLRKNMIKCSKNN